MKVSPKEFIDLYQNGDVEIAVNGELFRENMKTVKQYADENGITVQAVYGRIKKGKLATQRIGNLIVVVGEKS